VTSLSSGLRIAQQKQRRSTCLFARYSCLLYNRIDSAAAAAASAALTAIVLIEFVIAFSHYS